MRIAIIGAGYAGMAAATELAAHQLPVTVFEASRILGGRARVVQLPEATVDNGQHILIGAYAQTLRLMKQVGLDPDEALLRIPLTLDYPGVLRIAAPRLPAPLHLAWALLAAKGLKWADKLAAIRFMQAMKARGFQLEKPITLAGLLDEWQQPPRLRQYLWDALCVAALNTPTEVACAQTFLNVLRDTLAAGREASDLLLPRIDLSALFPEAAARHLLQHSTAVQALRRATPVRKITHDAALGAYHLHTDQNEPESFTHVILATAHYHAGKLLDGLPYVDKLQQQLAGFFYQPIVTAYLAYPETVRLPGPMLGHAQGLSQWLFDRGQLGGPPGLLAAVISAEGPHLNLDHDTLCDCIEEEIRSTHFPRHSAPLNLPRARWRKVITEKRATWSCLPGVNRPDNHTPMSGLLLAGDYTAGDYPGTIEMAVQSGIAAARLIRPVST